MSATALATLALLLPPLCRGVVVALLAMARGRGSRGRLLLWVRERVASKGYTRPVEVVVPTPLHGWERMACAG